MNRTDEQNPMKENIHTRTNARFFTGSNIFPCYARTEKRFKPYFSEQIGKEIGMYLATLTDEEGLSYNPVKDCFTLNTSDNQREEYASELIMTDSGPMRLYPIGSMQGMSANSAWQWQEVKKSRGSE